MGNQKIKGDLIITGSVSDGSTSISTTNLINGAIKITWANLKTLRDNSQLVPGKYYRITDYECTTTQENTSSAGHRFDIIVSALSENELSEEALAARHDILDTDHIIRFTCDKPSLRPEDEVDFLVFSRYSDGDYSNAPDYYYCYKAETIRNGSPEQIYVYTTSNNANYSLDYSHIYTQNWEVITSGSVNLTAIGSVNSSATDIQYDDYFSDNKLDSWKIWYCLDNDSDRFAWAQNYKNEFILTGSTIANSVRLYRCPALDGLYQTDYDYAHAWIRDNVYHRSIDPIEVYYSNPENEQPQSISDTTFVSNVTTLMRATVKNGKIIEVNTTAPYHGSRIYSGAAGSYADGVTPEFTPQTDGKGVIYRMIDEFGNDCPYDFKNILFTKTDEYTNAYTFSYTPDSITIKDASLMRTRDCRLNIIKKYIYNTGNTGTRKQKLNFNVFYAISAAFFCLSNTFDSDCHDNTFGAHCYYNTFGAGCYSNKFGSFCNHNTFGANCYSNKFSSSGCQYNTFGESCSYITLGSSCIENTFGAGCHDIIFGTKSGDTITAASFYRRNIIDNGCAYLCLNAPGTASNSNQIQNVHIHLGVAGTSSSYKTITVARNSNAISQIGDMSIIYDSTNNCLKMTFDQ